jgi:hypothetical protein
MDDAPCRSFFLEPSGAPQRQYEALRAVFVEGCRQKDVADRFGYDYAAFRQFRTRCAAGPLPPFSAPPARGARPAKQRLRRPGTSAPPWPIADPPA